MRTLFAGIVVFLLIAAPLDEAHGQVEDGSEITHTPPDLGVLSYTLVLLGKALT